MRFSTFIKNILPYGISNHFVQKKIILKSRTDISSSEEPPVFNSDGQKLKTIFLSDDLARSSPYSFVLGRYPRYILWDRHNYGLKNHMYSHRKILSVIGSPRKKFATLQESEVIAHDDFKIFDRHSVLKDEFTLIFTHNARLLDKYHNAVFAPASGVWYGTNYWGGQLNPEQHTLKTKNISMLSSNKTMCNMHKFRISLAKYYKNSTNVDTYGNFDGGNRIELHIPFEEYRYSIAIENEVSPYYFTEKILNCFASMTIPIYIGATKIADYFNGDGIIQVKSLDFENMDKIIADCNEKDYENRIPAIIDNYNRVQNFLCLEDYIYNNYYSHFA